MFWRGIAVAVLCCGSACAAGTAYSQTTAPVAAATGPGARITALEQTINEQLRRWDVPGASIAVVHRGQVILSRGYGVRDPRSRAPMTARTLIPTASLTKAFTAVAMGLLVEEGRLSFDGPMRSYLPGFYLADPAATHEVTVRDLLSHRSGLNGQNDFVYNRVPGMTGEEFLRRLPHFPMSGRARERYEYSNGAYVLLGQALERVAGAPYEEFVAERLFNPLGMRRSTFSSARAQADPDHAVGRWIWQGQPIYEFLPFGRIINPHGGVISTADDMANWMMMNLGGGSFAGRRLIGRSTLQEIMRTQITAQLDAGPRLFPLGYGMGWNTLIYREEPTVLHTGGVPGFRTITILVPGQELGVTVMLNSESRLFYPLAWHIVDSFMEGERVDWFAGRTPPAASASTGSSPGQERLAGPPSSHALDDFVGLYTHSGYGSFRIRRDNRGLVGEYSGHASPLVHRRHNVFQANPTTSSSIVIGTVQFHDNDAGSVAALTFGPFGAARFERQPDERLSDPRHLAQLVGTYHLNGTRFTITAVGARLVYQRDESEPAVLIPTLEGNYRHPRDSNLRISFLLGSEVRATAMVRHEGEQRTHVPRRP